MSFLGKQKNRWKDSSAENRVIGDYEVEEWKDLGTFMNHFLDSLNYTRFVKAVFLEAGNVQRLLPGGRKLSYCNISKN